MTNTFNTTISNAYVGKRCIDTKVANADPKLLPRRAHSTDAGADMFSAQDVEIYPGETKLVDTGVAVKIPEGYGGFLIPRSSQRLRGIITNGTGLIDSAYRGNVKVLLKNTSEEPYAIAYGDKIAQLVIVPVMLCDFVDVWNDTLRGTGGFGSTGV